MPKLQKEILRFPRFYLKPREWELVQQISKKAEYLNIIKNFAHHDYGMLLTAYQANNKPLNLDHLLIASLDELSECLIRINDYINVDTLKYEN
jgi:hypothetical protein